MSKKFNKTNSFRFTFAPLGSWIMSSCLFLLFLLFSHLSFSGRMLWLLRSDEGRSWGFVLLFMVEPPFSRAGRCAWELLLFFIVHFSFFILVCVLLLSARWGASMWGSMSPKNLCVCVYGGGDSFSSRGVPHVSRRDPVGSGVRAGAGLGGQRVPPPGVPPSSSPPRSPKSTAARNLKPLKNFLKLEFIPSHRRSKPR